MANYLWYRPRKPLTEEQVRKPIEALRDGVLKGRVDVEDHGNVWTLHWVGRPPSGVRMAIYLDEGGLSWSPVLSPEDEWLVNCVACLVVRSIDPKAKIVDECNERPFAPDFDKRYPTAKSYLHRPTRSRLFDAANRVASALSPKQPYDDMVMPPSPF